MLAIAPGCELEVERGPDCLLVRVRSLDQVGGEMPLVERLWSLLEQHFTYRLILELDEVEELDWDWIEQLEQLRERVEQHDGTLRLCGLSPAGRKALHEYHLDSQLPPYEDFLDAVMMDPHWRKPR